MKSIEKCTLIYGAIEAGGTKFVCAVGTAPDDIREETRFPTADPAGTLERATDFFRSAEDRHGKISSFGIASFGPLDLDERSPTYGFITSTPKPGWRNTDLVGFVKKAFQAPVGFDTDVNGAALGELRWGAGRGLQNLVYFTIGTGIGGGVVANGRPVHGLVHPELGHLRIPRDRKKDSFAGSCPFHGDCLEGLASGSAIRARWGRPGNELLELKEVWELEADYLALCVVNTVLSYSPERIILGGGVMGNDFLFPMVRAKALALLGGYVQALPILERIDDYLVPPGLGERSGIAGGFVLAEEALRREEKK